MKTILEKTIDYIRLNFENVIFDLFLNKQKNTIRDNFTFIIFLNFCYIGIGKIIFLIYFINDVSNKLIFLLYLSFAIYLARKDSLFVDNINDNMQDLRMIHLFYGLVLTFGSFYYSLNLTIDLLTLADIINQPYGFLTEPAKAVVFLD